MDNYAGSMPEIDGTITLLRNTGDETFQGGRARTWTACELHVPMLRCEVQVVMITLGYELELAPLTGSPRPAPLC